MGGYLPNSMPHSRLAVRRPAPENCLHTPLAAVPQQSMFLTQSTPPTAMQHFLLN